MSNVSSTQHYDDSTFNKVSRSAGSFASKLEPINRAMGAIGNFATGIMGLSSLGSRALKAPFELFEHGRKLSAKKSLGNLDKLTKSLIKDPHNFTEEKRGTALDNISKVNSFIEDYKSPSALIAPTTSPVEINSMATQVKEHKSTFDIGFESTKQQMIRNVEFDEKQTASAPSSSIASTPSADIATAASADIDPVASIEKVGEKGSGIFDNLSDIFDKSKKLGSEILEKGKEIGSGILSKGKEIGSGIVEKGKGALKALETKINKAKEEALKVATDVKTNLDIYASSRIKNTPQSIAACKTSIDKISSLIKKASLPIKERGKALLSKFDFAIRIKRWR